MPEIDEIRSLISSGKYRNAGFALDSFLRKEKDNDLAWYLRGIVSLKFKNYEYAHECFLRALLLNRKAEYYKIKGMAHMEMFELGEALSDFENALRLDKKDCTTYFFIAICFLLMGDPRSEAYLKIAWNINKRRTRELLKNFYDTILRPDDSTNKKLKEEVERELEKLV